MEKSIGPINSIVLARAGESDKIYKKDQNSIESNGLCELMIKENQFMNFNDRSDYLQGLADKLFGVEYYLNDFVSTGIMYYDLLDMYNIEIFGKTYNCLMLNDEQDITQGLEENIHTDRPETSETDYTKADKTDRKLNQTTLIVDKQNQKIEGVISQIGDRSKKTTTITADIDGLNSKVTNIADLTNTVSGIKTIILENCVEGKLLELNIIGNNTVFDYLYPSNDLYPSDTLYPRGDSRIIVTDKDGNAKIYELGITDVLRQKNNVYDEYILKDGKAQVIRRINKDGSIKDNEEIENLGEFMIYLKEGTNEIEIQNYSAQIRVKFALKSDYTDVFATRIEMNSEIKQTADSINLEVRKKVDENEVCSVISQSAEEILLKGNRILIEADYFTLNKDGTITCKQANIVGGIINLSAEIGETKMKVFGKDGTTEKIHSSNITPGGLNINSAEEGTEGNDLISLGIMHDGSEFGLITIIGTGNDDETKIYNGSANFWLGSGHTYVGGDKIETPILTQTSLAENKKNFEKLENALEIIRQVDIYKYNLKNEKDTDKKHLGFVIGDGYNYSKDLTSNNNDGADIYSLASCCLAGLKEAIQQIENMQKEIEKLKGGQANG